MSVEPIEYALPKVDWDYNIYEKLRASLESDPLWTLYHFDAGSDIYQKFKWLSATYRNNKGLQSGWKIHISASLFNAPSVLETVLPILAEFKINFKVTFHMNFLAHLNSNKKKKQMGKFITVYPENDDQAVKFANAVHNSTQSFKSPAVITDYQFRENSIVYYRYGAFSTEFAQSLWGTLLPIMYVNGKREFDLKVLNADFLKELKDPFKLEKTCNIPLDNQQNTTPKIINESYIEYFYITETDSNELVLCIDVNGNRRCIIKRAEPNTSIDISGFDAIKRLKIEEKLLLSLQETGVCPKLYDAFYDEEGRYCLVMEDIPGISLLNYLQSCILNRKSISIRRRVNWAKDLARLMLITHEKNIIHGDLKLGNIILHDNNLTLIDFDSASDLKNDIIVRTCGSIGFTTKNRNRGDSPVIADDIYGYGAVLYYLFGYIDPTINPLEIGQQKTTLALRNPQIPKYILQIVENCLGCQYESFSEVVSILNGENRKAHHFLEDNLTSRDEKNKMDFLVYEYINKAYNRKTKQYDFDDIVIGAITMNDFRGMAGSLLALSVDAISRGQTKHHDVIKQCAHQLLNKVLHYNKIAGLYVGESGKALALLYASIALKDKSLNMRAQHFMFDVNQIPLQSVDMFNGAAGRIRVNLIFWILTKNEDFLATAREQVNYLLNTKIVGEDYVGWYNPTTESTVDNMAINRDDLLLGYSHGIAGIGDALLDFYLLTKEQAVLDVVVELINTLMEHSKTTNHGKSLLWPEKVGGLPLLPFWCHGGAGIGVFMCRAIGYGICGADDSLIKKIVYSIVQYTRNGAPILCHGSLGSLECLLDIRHHMPIAVCQAEINNFEKVIFEWLITYIDNSMKTTNSQFSFFGYLSGYAGIIAVYSRLALPDLPNPLHIEFAQYLASR